MAIKKTSSGIVPASKLRKQIMQDARDAGKGEVKVSLPVVHEMVDPTSGNGIIVERTAAKEAKFETAEERNARTLKEIEARQAKVPEIVKEMKARDEAMARAEKTIPK